MNIFKSADIPEQYKQLFKEEMVKVNFKAAKLLTLLNIITVPVSGVFDYIIPDIKYFNYFFSIRIFVSVAALFNYFLLVKFWKDKGNIICILDFVITSVGLTLILRTLGYDHSYYALYNLLYIVLMMLPFELLGTFLMCLFIFSLYIVPVLLFDIHKLNIPVLINNVGFQWETIFFTCIINHFQSNMRKNNIINRFIVSDQAKALEEKSQELSKSYDNLKKTEKAKREFIANITHDIKSPLSVIRGQTDVMNMMLEPGSGIWKKAQFINKSAMQLSGLIDKIITVSMLDAEQKIILSEFDYTEFIKEQFALYQDIIKQKEIVYKLELIDEKIVVRMSSEWMERIFSNLLTNAVKFTNTGGSITVRVSKDNRFVYTEVEDTGIGIEEGKIERIFERKYQAHEDRKTQGYGLGLSIVKDALRIMDGEIEVRSEVGKGSIFKYKIPLAVNQSTKTQIPASPVSKNLAIEELTIAADMDLSNYENQCPEKPTILIVEDTPGQIDLIIENLKNEYNLMFALSGIQGIKKLKSNEGKVSLILSDVKMPEMDGLEFCRQIFSIEEYRDIPLIFLTAYKNEEEEFKGLHLGATDYISKPVNIHILKEKIRNCLERKK